MTDAIVVEGLVKRFGETQALAGVDLTVAEGTVLGLLGPNGAGKTTCVRILSTLLRPDEGRVTVAGLDVVTQARDVRGIIGLTGQYAAVDEYLTGLENLEMVGRLYRLGARRARSRAELLLERFDLTEAAGRPARTYSGGMRRRLDIAASLIARPRVLFLDEPTTGLDPRSRLGMWELIAALVNDGTTILLTTQYLEEADRLADRMVVIDHGRVIARGTADDLKAQVGGERLEFTLGSVHDAGVVATELATLAIGPVQRDDQTRRVVLPVAGGAAALAEALRRLEATGVVVLDVGLRRPDLDDVFLTLTGRSVDDDGAGAGGSGGGEGDGGGGGGGGEDGSSGGDRFAAAGRSARGATATPTADQPDRAPAGAQGALDLADPVLHTGDESVVRGGVGVLERTRPAPGRERAVAAGAPARSGGRVGAGRPTPPPGRRPGGPPTSEVGAFVSDCLTITRRNLIKVKRVPDLLVFATASPIMFVLLFRYVFGGAIELPSGITYAEFLLPGIFAQTVVFGSTITGASLADDQQKGLIDRFRSLPMSRAAVLVGRTLADVALNVVTITVMMLTGLAVGWRIHTSLFEALSAVLLLLLFSFAISWVMAFVGLNVRTPEVVNNASFIVIFPLTFIANTFVPTTNFPAALKAFSDWNPVSALVQAGRELFGNTSPGLETPNSWALHHPVPYVLIWVVLLLAVFMPLAVRSFQRVVSR